MAYAVGICSHLKSKTALITTLFVTTAQKLAMQSTERNPIRFVLIFRF
jgi:hypothetical protein